MRKCVSELSVYPTVRQGEHSEGERKLLLLQRCSCAPTKKTSQCQYRRSFCQQSTCSSSRTLRILHRQPSPQQHNEAPMPLTWNWEKKTQNREETESAHVRGNQVGRTLAEIGGRSTAVNASPPFTTSSSACTPQSMTRTATPEVEDSSSKLASVTFTSLAFSPSTRPATCHPTTLSTNNPTAAKSRRGTQRPGATKQIVAREERGEQKSRETGGAKKEGDGGNRGCNMTDETARADDGAAGSCPRRRDVNDTKKYVSQTPVMRTPDTYCRRYVSQFPKTLNRNPASCETKTDFCSQPVIKNFKTHLRSYWCEWAFIVVVLANTWRTTVSACCSRVVQPKTYILWFFSTI